MLMMRLQRIGRKNEPHYRVVITDRRNATKSGKFIDVVGSYNPKSGVIAFNAEKTKTWISTGAQPSPTIHNFLVSQNLIEGKKVNVLPKKSKTVKRKDAKKK